MLSNTLVTNEVKDAAGVEVEFERISMSGQQTIYRKVGEAAGLPYRLTISHSRSGKDNNAIRSSVVRFDVTSENTAGVKVATEAHVVLRFPEGVADNYDDAKKCLAHLMSFIANTGADTAIKFDCTGNGAATLLNETL